MAITFVHAADLHLDAPFQGIDASDERVRTALMASTYEALDRIVGLCLDESVDFLVISGDVYNNRDKSLRSQFRFQAAVQRLAEAGIHVFVANGNHDPAEGWSAGLPMPDTVHYFSTNRVEAVPFERDGDVICTLYGRGYPKSAEKRDFAKDYRRAPEDRVAIGVLHTNVGGREGYEDYAPASMDELRAARMDYWALGHIHKPDVLSEDPRIVYAGCPQGLNPKEDGPRGCFLVTIDGATVSQRFRPTHSVMWLRETCDVSSCDGIDDVRETVLAACAAAREQADGRPVVIRLDLVGRTEAHAALARGTAFSDLANEVRDQEMLGDPWVWIDRLLDRTDGAHDIEAYREAQEFGGDLVRLADEVAADPGRLDEMLVSVLGPLEASVGELDLGMTAADLLARARDLALDRLEGDGR
jgi:DNA repair exonuclease SbcCD nuclease subunit